MEEIDYYLWPTFVKNRMQFERGINLPLIINSKANASIFGAYAEGPCAGASAEAAHVPYTPIAGAAIGAEASLFKTGVRAGPAVAELNPNLNTGASIR